MQVFTDILSKLLLSVLFYLQELGINLLGSCGLEKVRSILVYRLDHIGDAVLNTGVLTALKNKFPSARLTLVTGSWNRDLFRYDPRVDRLLLYDSPKYVRPGREKRKHGFTRLYRTLKHEKNDLVVSMRGDIGTFFLTLLNPPGCLIQRDSGEFPLFVKTFLTRQLEKVGCPGFSFQHEFYRNLEVLREKGIETDGIVPRLYVSDKEIISVRQRLNLKEGDRFAVFHPFVSLEKKSWPADNFARLARTLLQDQVKRIIIVGRETDPGVTGRIRAVDPVRVTDLCGKLGLASTVALIKASTLFVGCDSGPLHIAAVLGTPSVGIFAQSDPRRFGPLGPACRVVPREMDCQEFYRGTKPVLISRRCADEIEFEEVVQVINELLSD